MVLEIEKLRRKAITFFDAITAPTLKRIYLDPDFSDDLVIQVLGGNAKASSALTLTANLSDGDLIRIGTLSRGLKIYQAQTVLTDVDGHFLIGATPEISVINLLAAINLANGAGTLYAASTTVHPDVTAANSSVAASGVLTLTGNALNGETVTVNGKVYTFQTTLTDIDGNVFIGATASDLLDNLIAAIVLGAGAGTLYATSTTLHPSATAAAGVGDTMDLTAKTVGSGGNTIATTETMTAGSFGGATLSGGTDVLGATAKRGGTSSNAIETQETSATASWTAATMAGGTDFTGTLEFKTSMDDVEFQAVEVTDLSDGTSPVSATAPGIFRLKVGGMLVVLLDVTALSAGDMTVLGYHRGLARG